MRAPSFAFTIALPFLSLAPVLGAGHAAALPLERREPDSPKFYFPRHIKRQIGSLPFVNISLPIIITTSEEAEPTTTSKTTALPTTTGGLDEFLSSLLSTIVEDETLEPTDVPTSTEENTFTDTFTAPESSATDEGPLSSDIDGEQFRLRD
jgi:hypothetical protein